MVATTKGTPRHSTDAVTTAPGYLGTKLILKKGGSTNHRGYEVPNIRFVQGNTAIPVPGAVEDWEEHGDGGDYAFILLRRVPGEMPHDAWSRLSGVEREGIAKETAVSTDKAYFTYSCHGKWTSSSPFIKRQIVFGPYES